MILTDKIGRLGKRAGEKWVNSKHPKRTFWLTYTLIFLVLFSGIACGYMLFGKSFVFSGRMGDGLRQHYVSLGYYGEYLRELLANIFVRHSFEIPMWDLHIGYGTDILTTLHYYAIGDPLNLLSVFVPMEYTEYLYEFLLVLRMYLAGGAFSLYCLYHKNGRFPTLMGALLFAFCQWILVADFKHPFFINPCIYYPLLLLGIDKIFNKEKPYVYIITLAVSAMSNFYFFYMLGIFTVIYAVYRYIMIFKKVKVKELFGWLGRFAGYSVVGMLLSAVIFLPSVLAVLNTNRAGAENFISSAYKTKYYHMILPALMGKFQSSYSIIGVSAVGVLGLFLLFMKRKRNTELKLGFIMCMIFLLVPFVGHVLNGFSYATNRWSWALVMLVCYVFVKMYPSLFTLSKKQRWGLLAAVFCFGVYICVDSFANHPWNILAVVLLLGVLAVLFVGYGYFQKQRAVAGVVVLAGICFGTFVNFYFCFTSSGNSQSGIWKYSDIGTAYERNTGPVAAELAQIPDIHDYRYDQKASGILQNSTMLTGLNGGQFFFSLANGNVSRFQDELYSNKPLEQNYKNVNGRSYLMKLLSMKYFAGTEQFVPYGFEKIGEVIVSEDELDIQDMTDADSLDENSTSEDETDAGESDETDVGQAGTKQEQSGADQVIAGELPERGVVGIYEDPNALPMAYTYDSYIPRQEYEKMSVMEKQEALLQGVVLEDSALPVCEPEDDSVERPYKIIPLENCELFDNRIKAKEDGATCMLEFEGVPESEVYVAFDNLQYLEVNRRHKYSDEEWKALPYKERRKITLKDENIENQVWIDMEAEIDGLIAQKRVQMVTSKNNFYNGRSNFMNNMGYSEKPVTRIKFTFPSKGSYKYDDLSIYFQPTQKLNDYVNERKTDTVEELTIGVNQVSCRTELDAPRALVFSLPYAKGWTAKVDGQKAELKRANTMFMALELDAGEHEIELSYTTPYMKLGVLLSVTGVLVLIVMIVLDMKKKRNTV
ncbi:YfhO family protein [Blautia schinkii]|nr:YfhO family protein [Blautia schinkii]